MMIMTDNHMIGIYNGQVVEALAACNEMCLQTYHKPVQTYETGQAAIAEQVNNVEE